MGCLSYVALVACRSNGKGFPLKITIVNQFCPPDLSPTARLIASLAQHRVKMGRPCYSRRRAGVYCAPAGYFRYYKQSFRSSPPFEQPAMRSGYQAHLDPQIWQENFFPSMH